MAIQTHSHFWFFYFLTTNLQLTQFIRQDVYLLLVLDYLVLNVGLCRRKVVLSEGRRGFSGSLLNFLSHHPVNVIVDLSQAKFQIFVLRFDLSI